MNKDLQVEASGFKNPNDSDHPNHREGGLIATCRICYGDKDVDLISPCMCKGTGQYVHRSCLDHWRSVKGELHFSHCSTCKAQFHLRVVELEESELSENWRHKINFGLNVARDVCLVFLAVQLVIGMMGVVAYLVDKDGSIRNFFDDIWELSGHPLPFYYGIGLDVFFWLLGIVGMVTFISWRFFERSLSLIITFFFGMLILPAIRLMLPAQLEPAGKCFTLRDFVRESASCIGIVSNFFIFAVIVCKIWERHCHILPKRELTKEYVVEDLSGCYTPVKLDPEQMERLTLKLNEVDWRLLVDDICSFFKLELPL